MQAYLIKFKNWYEQRNTRERILVVFVTGLIYYALFYFIAYQSAEEKMVILNTELTKVQADINHWKIQIETLKKIAQTPAYLKWQQEQKAYKHLRGQYKFLIASSRGQWQKMIETLLKKDPNITLISLQNFPETSYTKNVENGTQAGNLYQQRFALLMNSQYFDTINYLERLEKTIPNLHWDNLNYEVVNYPNAKILMEFSIFYEKQV